MIKRVTPISSHHQKKVQQSQLTVTLLCRKTPFAMKGFLRNLQWRLTVKQRKEHCKSARKTTLRNMLTPMLLETSWNKVIRRFWHVRVGNLRKARKENLFYQREMKQLWVIQRYLREWKSKRSALGENWERKEWKGQPHLLQYHLVMMKRLKMQRKLRSSW